MSAADTLRESAGTLLRERVQSGIAVKESLLNPEAEQALQAVADALVASLRLGGKVLLCGNGGSAADAQHLAAELVGRLQVDRAPLPAVSLADNVAALTAIGNDYAFADVFARAVRGLGRPGDVVVGLSTSGRSENVVRALEAGRELGLVTVAFLGGSEGTPLEAAADHVLRVAAAGTPQVQEAHMFLGHIALEIVERELCGR
jgi:D-sedoheptulose 7-phosphate isomerase